MELKINKVAMLERFEKEMTASELSRATIGKYLRDAAGFMDYAGEGAVITKDLVIAYKQNLRQTHAVTSINSMIAAINCFLRAVGCGDCVVRAYKIQRPTFREKDRELTKEEYVRLLRTALAKGKLRLCLIMETIGATGIRISELPFITVEAVHARQTKVSLKGKTRTVILPADLCSELEYYIKAQGIRSGSVFITRNGKQVDRSNVLHEMKALCKEAQVEESKVFPHNLRHLFATTYYRMEKDVCHLADLLGHSSINTTRVYTLVSCEEQEEQINGLGLCCLKV